MKNVILLLLTTLVLFTGCGSESTNVEETQAEVSDNALKETEVINNNAKSKIILKENQIKSNVSYTHFGVTGARYQYK